LSVLTACICLFAAGTGAGAGVAEDVLTAGVENQRGYRNRRRSLGVARRLPLIERENVLLLSR